MRENVDQNNSEYEHVSRSVQVWVGASLVTVQSETESKEVFSDKCVSSISKDQIQQLQHEDPAISSVIKLKKQKLKPINKERSVQPANVKKLYVIGRS